MSEKIKLSCQVLEVGDRYQDFLSEGMILLFPAETVMTQIKNYSLMVSKMTLQSDIELGDTLSIGSSEFKITDVGHLVNSNIEQIGHFTIKVENKDQAKLPGTLYIEPTTLNEIKVGEKIIVRGE
ncbi:PTS glucitol/sorbitol transporter subunit IIA [Vagococcus carniphilus]|uniref:PTS glucitol/sorbitol transporter subunit IIA n=1 Tax=Vagococcus carniphilus TaxID=218144 RepID=UPI00288E0705|nr:PTS glucitol/sorbitol transporter subunit IIA [Vagococcus carniphilus]MDT2831963.1 PTS glucitol/sorbitol transporter subunit IIA [Vagococcus carniphilus]MDT2840809.1 PTS glucitol/sorbitol transporter subunit IIA [Vagococcus carniphilus]MDT2855473.1 PTS glucitol/sorbitol transporter subunit IIA [Vagococcus carniphilus]